MSFFCIFWIEVRMRPNVALIDALHGAIFGGVESLSDAVVIEPIVVGDRLCRNCVKGIQIQRPKIRFDETEGIKITLDVAVGRLRNIAEFLGSIIVTKPRWTQKPPLKNRESLDNLPQAVPTEHQIVPGCQDAAHFRQFNR